MLAVVLSVFLASASAIPIEDTPEVAAARAEFQAMFDDAAAGGLAAKQAAQIPEEYLPLDSDVEAARAEFMAAFDDAAAGGLAAKQAPAPAEPMVAAPVAVSAYLGAFPHVYHHTPIVYNSVAAPVTAYHAAAVAYHHPLAYSAYYPYLTYPTLAAVSPMAEEPAAMPAVEAEE